MGSISILTKLWLFLLCLLRLQNTFLLCIFQAHKSEVMEQDAKEMQKPDKKQGKLVTMEMIKKWKAGLEVG